MSDLHISDDLLRLLTSVAQKENLPVEEVVESVLMRYAIAHRFPQQPLEPETKAPENEHPFLVIARAADELGEGSKIGNISERSREILNNDFPEYLMRRMRGNDANEE